MSTPSEEQRQAVAAETDGGAGPGAPKKRQVSKRVVIPVVLVLVVAGLLGIRWIQTRPTELEAIGTKCKHSLGVSDDGHTMRIQLAEATSKDLDIMAWVQPKDVSCIFDGLKVPSYVRDHILSTRALDGQQVDEWGNLQARWTYHPDNGLKMTIRDDG